MKIYDSKVGELVEFIPVEENKLNLYVCGPTIYSDIHIGNARPLIFFDMVANYFRLIGYDVNFTSNITDIDDKIIERAQQLNISEEELTAQTKDNYFSILNQLDIHIDNIPIVTEYISDIIDYIQKLIDLGYAYECDGDVYFKTSKVKEYGTISNRDLNEQISGSRVEVNNSKQEEFDFVLWKKTSVGINYDSQFSRGRPGWHTECVVMIDEIFNKTIDIHGGGVDLKFPHHENENAQSNACNHVLANYWMHNGLINFNNIKMSKSLGNVLLVKDVLADYGPNFLRLLMVQNSYRSPININDDYIKSTITLDKKFQNIAKQLDYNADINLDNSYVKEVIKEIENDFKFSNVITLILKWSKLEITKEISNGILFAFKIINYKLLTDEIPEEVKLLIKDRDHAKKAKDFKKADEIRAEILDLGYEIKDTRDGVECQRI